jgi:hypothetical protein
MANLSALAEFRTAIQAVLDEHRVIEDNGEKGIWVKWNAPEAANSKFDDIRTTILMSVERGYRLPRALARLALKIPRAYYSATFVGTEKPWSPK